VTVAEEQTLMAFAADWLTTGMGLCQDLADEQSARSWLKRVLPYGLAGAMRITPTGWTPTEATRDVRLRLRRPSQSSASRGRQRILQVHDHDAGADGQDAEECEE
jgi:hypothetical protein